MNQETPAAYEAEKAVLGCVLLAPSVAEADALLGQLRAGLFHDGRHEAIYSAMLQVRREGHAVDGIMLMEYAKRKFVIPPFDLPLLAECQAKAVTVFNFPSYLGLIRDAAARRWTIARSEKLKALAADGEFSVEAVKAAVADLFEKSAKIGETAKPLIETVTLEELRAYQPDPKTYLVGAEMICRGEISLLAGWPGLGKSRLANTLAFAGARGHGTWMGYEVKRQFRTFVSQGEASMNRLKGETEAISAEYNDLVRFSKPCSLQFGRPEFRAELRRIWEQWPFDVLVLDHWLKIARDEGQADYLEALDNIMDSLPRGEQCPAIVIIAHLRKQRGGENWKPKNGRELLSEISGSFAIGAAARTVFVIQPATMDYEDDRIVFDCAKSNNDIPLPMSAWHRRNGEFLPCNSFDFDAWLCPPEENGRRLLTEQDLRDVFDGGRRKASRKVLVADLVSRGFAEPTAYRALSKGGKFADFILEEDGLLCWKG